MRKEMVNAIKNHNNHSAYNSITKLIYLCYFLEEKMDRHSQGLVSNSSNKGIKTSLLKTHHKCTQILLEEKASNPIN